MKKAFRISFLLVLITLASLVQQYLYLEQWSKVPRFIDSPKVLHLTRGESLQQLSEELAQEGVVDSAWKFYAWVRLFSKFNKFQAGQYRFFAGVAPQDIAAEISRGAVYRPVVLEVTIPEGFTEEKVLQRLAAHELGFLQELRELSKEREFLDGLKISGNSLEGYLYPATYVFYEKPSARSALSKIVETFWQRLPQEYEVRVKEKGLTLPAAIAFASLIEAESAVEEEKPMIAEVIWRRLRRNEPLGIDAAIIYGLADYQGNLRRRHLEDSSNPYNLRIHPGLPPTPICSPSASALEAVLRPTDFGFYYYVLDPSGERRHKFSRTLQEHNKHVQRLVDFERGVLSGR